MSGYAECSIDGCEGEVMARGWCNPHYQRWYKHGDPLWRPLTPDERFWTNVNKQPDGCWLWVGALHSSGKTGYGWTGQQLAHRRAYELMVGQIPNGLQLDHLCRVRLCVNPAHLEPVTQRENILRGNAPSAVTVRTGLCSRGHPMSGDNLITIKATGAHRCRACVLARDRERRMRRAFL